MVAVSSVGISRSGLDQRGQAALQRPGAFISECKYRGSHPVNNEAKEKMPLTQDAKSADKALPLALVVDGIERPVELPRGGVPGLVDLPKCRHIQRIGEHDRSLRVSHVTTL